MKNSKALYQYMKHAMNPNVYQHYLVLSWCLLVFFEGVLP